MSAPRLTEEALAHANRRPDYVGAFVCRACGESDKTFAVDGRCRECAEVEYLRFLAECEPPFTCRAAIDGRAFDLAERGLSTIVYQDGQVIPLVKITDAGRAALAAHEVAR